MIHSWVKNIKDAIKVIQTSNKMKTTEPGEFPHVDFTNRVVYSTLKQIKYDIKDYQSNPPLVKAWACRISPRQAQSLIKFVLEYIAPYDPYDFHNLKRIQRVAGVNNTFELYAILCLTALYDERAKVQELLSTYAESDLQIDVKRIDEVEVPAVIPDTKVLCDEWSKQYWPMSWKGNPNHQFLKNVKFDLNYEKKMIRRLISEWEDKKSGVVTLVVDPSKSEENAVIAVSRDCRKQHPLHHSIMMAIDKVAQMEKERRDKDSSYHDDYLLNGKVIYTTHEPCVMCSMALVHSRIQRVVYLKPLKNGGLESNYQLGDRPDLNWRFEIWRWLDQEDVKRLD